jgi:hypothetical protein
MAFIRPANGESSIVKSQFLREKNDALFSPILPPLDLDLGSEPEPVDLSTKQEFEFPGILGIPEDVDQNGVDRVNLLSNCTDSKFIDMLCSKDLVNWGVITRPDGKMGFQFITKRKVKTPKTPKKSPAKFKWTKAIAVGVNATISSMKSMNLTNLDMSVSVADNVPSVLVSTI